MTLRLCVKSLIFIVFVISLLFLAVKQDTAAAKKRKPPITPTPTPQLTPTNTFTPTIPTKNLHTITPSPRKKSQLRKKNITSQQPFNHTKRSVSTIPTLSQPSSSIFKAVSNPLNTAHTNSFSVTQIFYKNKSIKTFKSEAVVVNPGANLKLFGDAPANQAVELQVGSSTVTTKSSEGGKWNIDISFSGIKEGIYSIAFKIKDGSIILLKQAFQVKIQEATAQKELLRIIFPIIVTIASSFILLKRYFRRKEKRLSLTKMKTLKTCFT